MSDEVRRVSISSVLERHVPVFHMVHRMLPRHEGDDQHCAACDVQYPCDAREMAEALAALATPEGLAAFLVTQGLPLPEELAAHRPQDEVATFVRKLEAGMRKMPERERGELLAFGDQMIAQIEDVIG